MAKKLHPLYVVFSGNICSGKDTIIDLIRQRNKLEVPGIKVTFLKEAVNNDKDVLKAFYDDQKITTFPFEISTLGARLVLSSSINNFPGIVIGNRNVIEARHTFVEHAFSSGFLNGMQIGMYDLVLRTAVDNKTLISPDVVFFLDVPDPEILYKRKGQRADSGEEGMSLDYLKELIPYFDKFKNNMPDYYKNWGLKVPKFIVLDASKDITEMPKIAEHCEKIIMESFKEKFPLKIVSSEEQYY
jgi:deoxyadenosine/deoxycytidine kinase